MRYSQAITPTGLGITPSLLKLWQRLWQMPGTVLVAGLTLMVAWSGMSLESWQFQSPDLLAGRPWTTLTSHLLHFDASHLFWDLSVFVGVGAALERKRAGLFWTTLLVAAWVVPPLAVLGQSVGRYISRTERYRYRLVCCFRDLAMEGPTACGAATGSADVYHAIDGHVGEEPVRAGNGLIPVRKQR